MSGLTCILKDEGCFLGKLLCKRTKNSTYKVPKTLTCIPKIQLQYKSIKNKYEDSNYYMVFLS